MIMGALEFTVGRELYYVSAPRGRPRLLRRAYARLGGYVVSEYRTDRRASDLRGAVYLAPLGASGNSSGNTPGREGGSIKPNSRPGHRQ